MQTFGAGMHYCLGANLARLELAEALAVMTRRMPSAHRTGPAPWKPLNGIAGPSTLPIEFDRGPGEPAAVTALPRHSSCDPQILAW